MLDNCPGNSVEASPQLPPRFQDWCGPGVRNFSSTTSRVEKVPPWVGRTEVIREELQLGRGQSWDHLRSIGVVFRASILGLEQELDVRREVGDSGSRQQDGPMPRPGHHRIPPINPALVVTLADRQVDRPSILGGSAGPHVVYPDLEVPSVEPAKRFVDRLPADTYIKIVVLTPGPSGM